MYRERFREKGFANLHELVEIVNLFGEDEAVVGEIVENANATVDQLHGDSFRLVFHFIEFALSALVVAATFFHARGFAVRANPIIHRLSGAVFLESFAPFGMDQGPNLRRIPAAFPPTMSDGVVVNFLRDCVEIHRFHISSYAI